MALAELNCERHTETMQCMSALREMATLFTMTWVELLTDLPPGVYNISGLVNTVYPRTLLHRLLITLIAV